MTPAHRPLRKVSAQHQLSSGAEINPSCQSSTYAPCLVGNLEIEGFSIIRPGATPILGYPVSHVPSPTDVSFS
jgi:hypothetical protein